MQQVIDKKRRAYTPMYIQGDLSQAPPLESRLDSQPIPPGLVALRVPVVNIVALVRRSARLAAAVAVAVALRPLPGGAATGCGRGRGGRCRGGLRGRRGDEGGRGRNGSLGAARGNSAAAAAAAA